MADLALGSRASVPRRGAPDNRQSAPHPAHASAYIDRLGRDLGFWRGVGERPCAAFEMAQNFGRDETRARGVHVTVAVRPLAVRIKTLRHDQVQMIFG